jgi:FMN phosphatase YigB (HAD superfamily)
MRQELIKSLSHREVFEKLAVEFGTEETKQNLKIVYDAFYLSKLPPKLPLIKGARENIDYLKTKYSLFLVTAGLEDSQMGKVKALGIESDFKKIFIVNSILKHKKKDAFHEIIEMEKISPSNLLCIGNSLLSEIKDAIEIGAQACYYEHGEQRGEISDLPRPPDYIISTHAELLTACRL